MRDEAHDHASMSLGHTAVLHAGAIGVLLISDSLFRINHVEKRKKYVALVDGVRDAGGEALVRACARTTDYSVPA